MNNRVVELISAVENSILAIDGQSKLTDDIFKLQGYSGEKYRRFINSLLSQDTIKNYLEIGVWLGSTTISGLYGNEEKINHWLIDNFCMTVDGIHGSVFKKMFLDNCKKHLKCVPNLIDADSFLVDLQEHNIKDVDVYFYDGEHESEDHKKALTCYIDAMKDEFIFIVDDWGWDKVKLGTYKAISQLNLKIEKVVETIDSNNPNGWWNGCGIFVLSKYNK